MVTEHQTHGHTYSISSKYIVTSPTLQWHTRSHNTVQREDTPDSLNKIYQRAGEAYSLAPEQTLFLHLLIRQMGTDKCKCTADWIFLGKGTNNIKSFFIATNKSIAEPQGVH